MFRCHLRLTVPVVLAAMNAGNIASADNSAILSRQPADGAPAAVKAMQPLIGDWLCGSTNRQPDGSWKQTPYTHEWRWYYTLNGLAVQDYWLPDEDSETAPGTNLRIYDPDSDAWFIAWTKIDMNQFEKLSATWQGDEMILTGHKPPGGEMPEHDRRITFHNISEEHFDWKYEASADAATGEWREAARLSCDRG